MTALPDFTFTRYLASKKSVDDRALNRHVWECLSQDLSRLPAPLQVLEIGAGIGTMLERAVDRNLLPTCDYRAIDEQADNIAHSLQRIGAWAGAQGMTLTPAPATDGWRAELSGPGQPPRTLHLHRGDAFEFAARPSEQGRYDLLIAHAVLDLFDIRRALPPLLALLKPGGYFLFTINFDGATLFQPTIEPALDDQIEQLYHRTMDQRLTDGLPSGDSRTGRHLFSALPAAGGAILAAGASDWVVHPLADGRYPGDEAYFLHFIIHTVHGALRDHPELNSQRLEAWVARRHAQIAAGQLVYIAHQLDFCGRRVEESSHSTGQ